MSGKGGKHDEAFYALYFSPGPRAFFDTLIPDLVQEQPWDLDHPNLAKERGLDGSEVSR
jgi:hypothetical protein